MNGKIIFVSYIQDPYNAGTSTQIMTENLLCGLKMMNLNILFVAVVDNESISGNVKKRYSMYSDDIVIIKSRLNNSGHNKYAQLALNLYSMFTPSEYEKKIRQITVYDNDIIITHTPSLEPVPIVKELKKKNNNVRYIQYWSDPYTLSGIIPENFNLKRIPFYFLEKYILSQSNDIVYGTKTLLNIQQKLFTKEACKMRYIDVSYCTNKLTHNNDPNTNEKIFGYSGNYYSNIRNIQPLYEAFNDISNCKLMIIGSGNVKLHSTKNIEILHRVPQSDIEEYENKMDVLICILNSGCAQIPGKVFYNTNSDKPILVILDGPYKNEIKEYLMSFERFEFCNNEKHSIKAAVNRILSKRYSANLESVKKLSPKSIIKQLLQI